MFRSPRYAARAVLALALLVHAGRAHAGPFIRLVEIEPSPVRWAGNNPSLTIHTWVVPPLSPSIGDMVARFDLTSQTFTQFRYSGELLLPPSASPWLPDPGKPTKGPTAEERREQARREVLSRLVEQLDNAARQDNRFKLVTGYGELHVYAFDQVSIEELSIDEPPINRVELLQRAIVKVPSDSLVHICGQPALGKNCFTTRKLLLPENTPLYLIDTSGLWKLVAHAEEKGKLGAFVGWIQMDNPASIPGRPSSAVAAIVLESPHPL